MNDHSFVSTPTVRLRCASDVLTAVPFLLGFTPDRSLVVLAMAEGRLHVTARLDLPPREETPAAATSLVELLSHGPVSEVIVVGYGDESHVVPVVTELAELLPWPVRDVMRVDGGRWWSLTCPDPECCQPGAPLPTDAAVTTALLVASGSPAASRADLAATLQPADQGVVDDVRAALRSVPSASASALFATVGTAVRVRRERRRPLDPPEAAMLLDAVRNVLVRDACCAWSDRGALNLWLDLLPLAPAGWVAPVATLLAVASYQRGDGALAGLALERALSEDPDYRLAVLLDQLIGLGVPPTTLRTLLLQALEENPLTAAHPAD